MFILLPVKFVAYIKYLHRRHGFNCRLKNKIQGRIWTYVYALFQYQISYVHLGRFISHTIKPTATQA
jgi:hypothetical protein